MMKWKARSGSAIAEASIVLPIIILAVLACVLYCLFCFTLTEQQCRMHAAIRKEAVLLTARAGEITTGITWDGEIHTARKGLFQRVSGKETLTMNKQGIMNQRVSADIEGIWQASDGVSFVRRMSVRQKKKDSR